MRHGHVTRDDGFPDQSDPMRFPVAGDRSVVGAGISMKVGSSNGTADDGFDQLFNTIDSASRRIDDLARQLNCLGFFNSDDDDRPRAA